MASASPPTDRVTRVLRLLSDADEPVSASEAARRLDVSPSTCAAVLQGLEEAGYVSRDADKRYRLGGPGLLPLLRALRDRYPFLGAADDEVARLAETVGYGVTLTRITADHLLVVAAAGPLPEGVASGDRFPLTPPYGIVAAAFGEQASFDRWMDTSPMPLDRGQRSQLRRAAKEIRSRGYAVWGLEPSTAAAVGAIRRALDQLVQDPTASAPVRAQLESIGVALGRRALEPDELTHPGPIAVAYVCGAVPAAGAPRYQLELHLLEHVTTGDQLSGALAHFSDTAMRLGAVLGGRSPASADGMP